MPKPIIKKSYASSEDAKLTYSRLNMIAPPHGPAAIQMAGNHVWHDIVEGVYPHDLKLCWQALHDGCWSGTDLRTFSVESYARYIESRLEYVQRKTRAAVQTILCNLIDAQDTLTPVRFCHGDATLENMLEMQGVVRLIDPGDPRGLPCRELDESKMLQSLAGWDELKYGVRGISRSRSPLPFEVKPVHWWLLATHLVRLIPHTNSELLRGWAHEKIEFIHQEGSLWPVTE